MNAARGVFVAATAVVVLGAESSVGAESRTSAVWRDTAIAQVPASVAVDGLLWAEPSGVRAPLSDDAEARVVRLIDGAEASLDLAVYTFGSDAIEDALLRASSRDVDVRVVVDPDHAEAAARLSAEGVAVHVPAISSLQHGKFVVVDRRTVWTGSANFTTESLTTEANNAVVIEAPSIAAVFTEAMEAMCASQATSAVYGRAFAEGSPTVIDTVFGRSGVVEQAVVAAIGAATESIDVAMYNFTKPSIAAEVIRARDRGVRTRVLLDDAGEDQNGSQRRALCEAGLDVRTEKMAVTLHHKYAVVDAGGDDPVVVTGSANWTGAGMERNYESVVLIHSGELAERYAAEWIGLAEAPGHEAQSSCDRPWATHGVPAAPFRLLPAP